MVGGVDTGFNGKSPQEKYHGLEACLAETKAGLQWPTGIIPHVNDNAN